MTKEQKERHIIVHEYLEDDLRSECQLQLTAPGSKQLGYSS